jgi:hypothetical protein
VRLISLPALVWHSTQLLDEEAKGAGAFASTNTRATAAAREIRVSLEGVTGFLSCEIKHKTSPIKTSVGWAFAL